MNDPRDKPPHSKHVKARTRETQYLKYRSFKPKCVESRVADYIKTKRSAVDNAGTATISASARFQQQQHHQPHQNAKVSRPRAVKTAAGGSSAHHQLEVFSVASESKKPAAKRPIKKDHRLQHKTNHNPDTKPHADSQEKEAHKTETNIQTDVRKTNPQPKSKQRHQHKKYKTFDIASFPRVFSTSDLMEKMNEEPTSDGSHEKCEFRDVDLRATAQRGPTHAADEAAQQLEFRNAEVDVDITCHPSRIDDTPVFPHVDSMVFKCEQPIVDALTPNSRGRSQNRAKSNDGRVAPNLARQNQTLKTEIREKFNLIEELHSCVHKLRDELRAKGDVEEELQRSKVRLNELGHQNAKLKGELEEKAALVELLSKRDEQSAGGAEQTAPPSTTVWAHEQTVANLRGECDSLRSTNAELLNDLRRYQTEINRLETKLEQREKTVRILEDAKIAGANQLNVYRTEIAFLNAAKAKLALEKQQLEARNKRLLNVLALNHVLTLSKQFPHTSGCGRTVIAPSFDAAASNTSCKRNRLQEIKHFNIVCQKFTSTQ